MRVLLRVVALGVAVTACSKPAAPSTRARVATGPPQPVAPAIEFDAAWGDYSSKRLNLTIPLPDARGWSIDDSGETWLVATHPGSNSTLLVRVWREADVINRERCEGRAREQRSLPVREGADIFRTARIGRPRDFDTVVEVGLVTPQVWPPAIAAPLDGFAMAHGGLLHKCFAWVFATRATGPNAERLVGARLAAMVDGSLGGIELGSDLRPTVPRDASGAVQR